MKPSAPTPYNSFLSAYPIATESGKVGVISVHSGLNIHGQVNAHGPTKAGTETSPLHPMTENGDVPGRISGVAYADAENAKYFPQSMKRTRGRASC